MIGQLALVLALGPAAPSDEPPPPGETPAGETAGAEAAAPPLDEPAKDDAKAAAEPEEPAGPAPLPEGAPDQVPGKDGPQALGSAALDPLPPAPAPVDPKKLRKSAWRGRGWFDVRVEIVAPIGTAHAGARQVVSGAGGLGFGWRLAPFVSLSAAIGTQIYEAGNGDGFDELGQAVTVVDYGRLVTFDLAMARFYLPTPRRFEPWIELGGGVGVWRGPFADQREALGLARAGIGADIWLSPSFSLALFGGWRLLGFKRNIGHTLHSGVALAVHW